MTDEEMLFALEQMQKGIKPPSPSDHVYMPEEEVIGETEPQADEPIGANGDAKAPAAPPKNPRLLAIESMLTSMKRGPEEKFSPDPETDALMRQLEEAQARDRDRNATSRQQAWNLMAGGAVSSGIGGLDPVRVNMPEHISEADQVRQRADVKDKLYAGQFRRENPEKERDLRETLQLMKLLEDYNKTITTEEGKGARQEDNQEFKSSEGEKGRTFKATEGSKARGFKASENEKDRRLGIVREVGKQKISDSRSAEQAGKEAARDARHQFRDYVWEVPVTDVVHNRASQAVSFAAKTKALAQQAKKLLDEDPRGLLFWGSDVRAKLKSAIIATAEANVKLGGNGVATGKDIENSLAMMGNLDSKEAIISDNGRAALDGFINNIDSGIEESLASLGARRRRSDEPYIKMSDAVSGGGGGGSGKSGPVNQLDPSSVEDYVNKGGPAIPGAPKRAPKGKFVNGKFVVE